MHTHEEIAGKVHRRHWPFAHHLHGIKLFRRASDVVLRVGNCLGEDDRVILALHFHQAPGCDLVGDPDVGGAVFGAVVLTGEHPCGNGDRLGAH